MTVDYREERVWKTRKTGRFPCRGRKTASDPLWLRSVEMAAPNANPRSFAGHVLSCCGLDQSAINHVRCVIR